VVQNVASVIAIAAVPGRADVADHAFDLQTEAGTSMTDTVARAIRKRRGRRMGTPAPYRALVFSVLLLAGAASAADPGGAPVEMAADPTIEMASLRQALDADPSSVAARLALARAYYAQGEYARALLEFEKVLDYDNLPNDLRGQAEVYDQAAADYAAGRKWRPFHYAESGMGSYRENSSSATDLFGGAGDYDTFLALRLGGGVNTSLGERHSFTGTLDYRFRRYDDSNRRDDSDLRWNVNVSRPVDDDNLRFGMRGRVSYRGDGQYRNDWGVFGTYRIGLGAADQLELGAEVRERRYPSGPLRSRTRDIAEFTGRWTHALANGRTSVTVGGQLTQEWATQDRPDGDGSFWGANGEIDHSFGDALGGFFWWSYVNESYDDERPDFSTDEALLRIRNDDLWNFGAGLVWNFGDGWSLRPTIEYNWEDSNIAPLAYSSTEFWVTARKTF
jgi:tetratricopeptide (TPR) repeat protein